MKKTIIQLSIICIVGLLLASCSTSYITKRRYTKGFYVEHKKHNSQPEAVAMKKLLPSTLIRKDLSLPVTMNEPQIKNPEINSEEIALGSTNQVREKKDPLPANIKEDSKLKTALKKVGSLSFSPFQVKADAEKIVSPEGGIIAATLSLFWIVLVILLVFYLIGIVFEGFGLGPIFNLFGLIILILLILWLLGVV